eukprot:jgi/Galph1/1377/GphlegSOOS_G6107.1
MYGAGKTTFGKRFHNFLVMNKEYIWQARSKQRLPGCATPEESLDALYNQTLYVYLELGRFPKEGHRFEYVLYQKICETALSNFPNGSQLLSEVLPLVPQGPSQWLAKLFQVTNKRFLFVCIDEIGFVGDEDFFQFKDLKSPSRGQSSSNVYLGRCDAIVRRQEDAMPSRISLRFLRLDPFSSDIVNDIVQLSRYGEETLREIIFPKTPQGNDWLSEIVWDYTVKDLKEKVETIHMIDSLFVHVDRMEPRVVGVFSSMLLASVLNFLSAQMRHISVDGVQSRKSVPLPEYVASLSSRVATEVSAAGSTYHPNAMESIL